MKHAVLLPYRVKLLCDGHSCYHSRRTDDPGRKSIRGCIVDIIIGPKPSTKFRRFFSLSKQDDAKNAKKAAAKPYTNAPKIQRLVTLLRLHRRRHLHSPKQRRIEHQKEQMEYDVLIAKRVREKKADVAAVKASHKTVAA
ncbi:hypothetical protein FIBSPDRAFT_952269 [Athelia psychrophila]|uniref:40S ribosomal protein S6 n=1 Tax=Athelia psychrophila TaxID=1759441 RepID=A0A166LQ91_9AGAM|nr:hypothetical protein FIBSPDRAFT_952269 [Fibularhizoctonia sp. CBS 109695]